MKKRNWLNAQRSALSGLVLLLACWVESGWASYADTPGVKAFIDEMTRKHGFERDWMIRALTSAEKQESIIKAMQRPAEKTLEWKDYRKIFLTEKRIQLGKAFLKKYQKEFARAEEQFGVPREMVAAIIGVETRYGQNKGSYRVVDALATLAFDYPPRSKFFTSELEQFFLLSREQGFDPLALKGSYAGAMGYGQFIPSSYRHYAVDFTSDGVADIINNPVDAIGSVANYFKAHGWKPGAPVVVRATVKNTSRVEPLLSKKQAIKDQWKTLRDTGVQTKEAIPEDTGVRLIRLVGDAGEEYWVAFQNFYVITRYNHSDLYAMAAYQLSRALTK